MGKSKRFFPVLLAALQILRVLRSDNSGWIYQRLEDDDARIYD